MYKDELEKIVKKMADFKIDDNLSFRDGIILLKEEATKTLNLIGADFYFCYDEDNEQFLICDKKWFDDYDFVPDWHISKEVSFLGNKWSEIAESCFEYKGTIEEGTYDLLSYGMTQNKNLAV